MSSYHVISILILAVVFLMSDSGNAQVDGYPSIFRMPKVKEEKQHYCGRNIPEALRIVCDGKYAFMFKKDGQKTEIADYAYGYVESFPFIPQTKANGMFSRLSEPGFRRQSRGIHEECCVKPCTIYELSTYCAPKEE